MYIHYFYKIINQAKQTKEYKVQLKQLTKLNLRRASKYNTLAVLGALQCLQNKKYEQENLGIYIASEFSCANEVADAVTKVNTQEIMPLMPFDFLNVNSNNVGFYIAKALDAKGKNTVLTSQDIGFEKALQVADFELSYNIVKSVLLGGVDVSIDELVNFHEYLPSNQLKTDDGSCWLYASNEPEGAVAKIEQIQEFGEKKELKSYLERIGCTNIHFNTIALKDQELQSYSDNALKNEEDLGVQIASKVVDALQKEQTLFISKARNGSFITFLVVKMPLSRIG